MGNRIPTTALVVLIFAGGARGAERQEIGKLVSAHGTLFQRTKPDEAWQIVPEKGAVYAGDLLLGMPGAVVETGKGAVRLTFLGDLDKNSPRPILEPAVILHPGRDRAIEIELDRGRIEVTNIKDKGEVRVGLRFRDQDWRATLLEPGASFLVELYGRWARGTRFTPNPGPKDVPEADLIVLVRKGNIELRHARHEHALSAPPGPALLHWESDDPRPEAPQKLDKLPAWAAEKYGTERGKQIEAALEAFRRQAVQSSPKEALRAFVQSDDPIKRSVAVVVMGGMDDIEGLANVITSTRHRDTWDLAVVVVRHWLGRRAGQDQLLYRYLIEKRDAKPAQAATILQLFHSFSEEDLAHPEVYRMLVRYLDNDRLGIRGLAYWHLIRHIPQGRVFGYDPLAPKEEREKARAQWKKLVDDKIEKGELPPKESSDK